MENKLKPKILRKSEPTEREIAKIKRNPIYLVLDNILDTYNIGSLFRLADAIAAEKMFLCGENIEYPPSSRIHKAAVGTENWVPWEKRETTIEVVKELKAKGVQIICVEQHPKAISYSLLASRTRFPLAIVCGHETNGISEEVLNEADLIAEIPMYGINNSFNVWGSTAVVSYKVIESLQ